MTKYSNLKVLLDVPYDYQLDNETVFQRPYAECQTSANYMMADYVTSGYVSDRAKANNMKAPVNWWAYHCKQRGDTTNGLAHSRVWEEMLGIPSAIRKDGSIEDLFPYLANDIPVAIGVHYKSSGHWITVTGVDVPNQMFRCHDPNGSRAGNNDFYASNAKEAGVHDYYSFKLMKQVWSCSEHEYQSRISGEGYGWFREIPLSYVDNPDESSGSLKDA